MSEKKFDGGTQRLEDYMAMYEPSSNTAERQARARRRMELENKLRALAQGNAGAAVDAARLIDEIVYGR